MDTASAKKLLDEINGSKEVSKQRLSSAIRKRARTQTFIANLGKKMHLEDYLAVQLWDLVTHGRALLAEGTTVEITDFKDWISAARFIADRMEGTPPQSLEVHEHTTRKPYIGISPDDWDTKPTPTALDESAEKTEPNSEEPEEGEAGE